MHVYLTGDVNKVGGLEAWQNMLDEYADLVRTGEGEKSFELWQKIVYCDWRLSVVEACAGVLRDIFVQSCSDALVEAGFSWVQNLEDDKEYQAQIDMVINETSSVVVRLNQFKTEYDRLFPPQVGEKPKRTQLDFDKELAILARHGYKVDKRRQTVTEYCAAVNTFFEEMKQTKKNRK